MGFEEGDEDESLLTCIVCDSPFGMTSRFCGECGSSREQALGIERARPSQKIRPAEAVHHFVDQPEESQIFAETDNYSSRQTVRRPSRWALLRVSLSMRIDNVIFYLEYHGKKIVAAGILTFLVSGYVFTQTIIFLNSSPVTIVDEYVKAVSLRDNKYFLTDSSLTPNKNITPLLPARFNLWPDAETASWINFYSWNGWLESGAAKAKPGADQTPLYIPFVATSKKKLGIFREDIWRIKGPMATVKIDYPKDASLPIYINGIYAGTVSKPLLPSGTYYALPGPLKISYGSNGEKTDSDVDFFIGSSGQYYA